LWNKRASKSCSRFVAVCVLNSCVCKRGLDTQRLCVDAACPCPNPSSHPPTHSPSQSVGRPTDQTTQTLGPPGRVRRTNTQTLYLSRHTHTYTNCCDAFLIWIINYTSRRPTEPQRLSSPPPQNAEREINIYVPHTHSYT
jgi:hypothetical protein